MKLEIGKTYLLKNIKVIYEDYIKEEYKCDLCGKYRKIFINSKKLKGELDII